MDKESIKNFAVDVLGCGCGQSVFNSIDVAEGVRLDCGVRLSKKILIGNRLLIYIADVKECSPADIESVVRDGLAERDANGYNRLRLVIVAPETEGAAEAYSAAFGKLMTRDEKCHIHIVKPGDAV
ncbi:MAG TPA: hypothetical protein PK514_14220 [Spirochaetota bacterium]|nr:hypothetical protein [Spirochaetota bacterium]